MNREQLLNARDLAQIGIFTSLTAIGAFISIPVGPVPITLQSFFVLLSGLVLGSKKAVLSQINYLLLGLVGFPVFSEFTGGLHAIYKPSFGFILGYIAAAYFTGKLTEEKNEKLYIWLAVLTGTLIIYAFGLPYMYFVLNLIFNNNFTIIRILQLGMFAFIPGDILKAVIIVFLVKKIHPLRGEFK